MLFGRASRKILLAPPKTKSSIFSVVRHDWIFKRCRVLWSDETKKKGFLAANTLDVFGANRNEEYPMPTVKYAAGPYMLWAYLFAGGPGHLVHIHGIMDSIKYKEIKKSKPDGFC